MNAGNGSGMVVGVFGDRARAQAATEALDRAGFPSQAIELVAPDLVDAQLLAELAEADDASHEESGRTEDTLVIISSARRDDARPILAECGAEDIVTDDVLGAAPPLADSVPAGGRGEVSAAALVLLR